MENNINKDFSCFEIEKAIGDFINSLDETPAHRLVFYIIEYMNAALIKNYLELISSTSDGMVKFKNAGVFKDDNTLVVHTNITMCGADAREDISSMERVMDNAKLNCLWIARDNNFDHYGKGMIFDIRIASQIITAKGFFA